MKPISLTTFLDFVGKQGRPKLTVIRRYLASEYDVKADFYKRIREAIVGIHRDDVSLEALDRAIGSTRHQAKREQFPGWRRDTGTSMNRCSRSR